MVYVSTQASGFLRCVNIGDQQTGSGVRLQDCNSSPGQLFRMVVYSGGWVSFRHEPTNSCWDVEGAFLDDGTRVYMWKCHGGYNQMFRVNGDGTISIKHSGKCVDISGEVLGDGAAVQQRGCDGGATQIFKIISAGGCMCVRVVSVALPGPTCCRPASIH